jgi:hypothetical protein
MKNVILIILLVSITSDQKIINTLYHLKRNGKDKEALNIIDEWYNSDTYSRHRFSDEYCIPEAEDVSKEVSNVNTRLFKDCEVIGTPTFFINGYKLPNQYNIEDIKYFAEIFKKKEMFNCEQ